MRELTTKEAVREYLSVKLVESKEDYTHFMRDMQESHGTKFESTQNISGLFEFVIVRLAIDANRLWDILSPRQANSLLDEIVNEHLRRAVEGEINKNIASSSFSQYLDLVSKDLENSTLYLTENVKRPPLEETTKQFLYNFLGDNIQEFLLSSDKFKGKQVINPFLVSHCCHNLINFKISWLAMKGNLKII